MIFVNVVVVIRSTNVLHSSTLHSYCEMKLIFCTLGLLSNEITGQQAAFRYVTELGPCEPEMWMALNDLKIAWTCSRTKRFNVPFFNSTASNTTVRKYMNRSGDDGLTLLEYLRNYDISKTPPKA